MVVGWVKALNITMIEDLQVRKARLLEVRRKRRKASVRGKDLLVKLPIKQNVRKHSL